MSALCRIVNGDTTTIGIAEILGKLNDFSLGILGYNWDILICYMMPVFISEIIVKPKKDDRKRQIRWLQMEHE